MRVQDILIEKEGRIMKEITETSFNLIKQVAANISSSKKLAKGIDNNTNLPNVVGIKLTNRCNLRCKHCYEWNNDGYHHNMSKEYQNTDIDFELLEKCIKETSGTKAMFYLWGGEPCLYKEMDRLLDLLYTNGRYTIICTNGTLLHKFYKKIVRFQEKIELLLAVDGDRKSHDDLRGTGNFDYIMEEIQPLINMKQNGSFRGTISVHTMVSNENILSLYDTVRNLDNMGIDNLLICLPWYISQSTSKEMDEYFERNFKCISFNTQSIPSWHAYKYHIKKENYLLVEQTLSRIRQSSFNMNIKFQPDIQGEELISFLSGDSIEKCDKRECYTVFSRMDVLPNGLVTSCKHFQELAYGDLRNNSLAELWNSEELSYIREVITKQQMPVCSKCNNLYNHSYKKKRD